MHGYCNRRGVFVRYRGEEGMVQPTGKVLVVLGGIPLLADDYADFKDMVEKFQTQLANVRR